MHTTRLLNLTWVLSPLCKMGSNRDILTIFAYTLRNVASSYNPVVTSAFTEKQSK